MSTSTSAEGILRRTVAGLVAAASLLLAWPVWQWTRADQVAFPQPAAALAIVPWHPTALEQSAALALDRRDLAAAEAAARAAMAARPLENRPYRLLAAIYEARGRDADALAAQRAAVTMSPRNAVSRLWLADRELRGGRFAEALGHLDWALRADRNAGHVVFPLLLSGLDNGPFRAALLDSLRQRPPWRAAFVRHLAERAPAVDLALPLFDALAADAALPPEERGPWIARLEREQRWDLFNRYADGATPAAAASTPAVAADAPAGIVDGEFERQPTGIGRDWRIGRVAGATITLSGNSGRPGGGRALTIEFANQRVPFDHVRQILQLAPGRYTLSGLARLDDLRAARGLRWRVICEDGRELGGSRHFVGRAPWRPWSFDFDVPAGCDAQWLLLTLDAVGPSEQLVGGSVRFDALAVAPASAAAADPAAAPASAADADGPDAADAAATTAPEAR